MSPFPSSEHPHLGLATGFSSSYTWAHDSFRGVHPPAPPRLLAKFEADGICDSSDPVAVREAMKLVFEATDGAYDNITDMILALAENNGAGSSSFGLLVNFNARLVVATGLDPLGVFPHPGAAAWHARRTAFPKRCVHHHCNCLCDDTSDSGSD